MANFSSRRCGTCSTASASRLRSFGARRFAWPARRNRRSVRDLRAHRRLHRRKNAHAARVPARDQLKSEGDPMKSDPIVIVSAARTPMGGFQGELRGFTAPELGAAAIRAAVERAKIRADEIEEAIVGCVLPAGQGQAPARQAALGAGLPLAVGCTTVNKMCGSGMKAAMFAHDLLKSGSVDVVVAGGMESMTNAPYLLPKARAGLRMGHSQVIDHMFYDGLEDAYDKGRLMGTFAEDCAAKYQFSREAQDEFAIASLTRAQKPIRKAGSLGRSRRWRSRRARIRSSSRPTSSRSRPTSRRFPRSARRSARTAR